MCTKIRTSNTMIVLHYSIKSILSNFHVSCICHIVKFVNLLSGCEFKINIMTCRCQKKKIARIENRLRNYCGTPRAALSHLVHVFGFMSHDEIRGGHLVHLQRFGSLWRRVLSQ